MLDNKTRIKQSLQSLSEDDFGHQVTKFLDILGYKSDRTHHDIFISTSEFLKEFPTQTTQSEENFLSEAKHVRVLFQLTNAEIGAKQIKILDENMFDSGKTKSFIFVAVELTAPKYPRGAYASFTREINKRFSMPVVVLFKTSSDLYTISFVYRRENQHDSTRHVLGPVSLIREIKSRDPHRAHVDILEALMMDERLKWIEAHNVHKKNFDGLRASWLNALDVEDLNKRFYCDLFAWFLHAVKHSKLPKSNLKSLKPEEHTLRLITRLLFIWFIKQKGLVSGDLFNETKIRTLLKNYEQNGDSYYRTILQNLFFATLNTKIDNRGFGDDPDKSLYHYENEMNSPEKLQVLFNKTPFINGGLFDCLDDANNSHNIDYFVNDSDQRRDYFIPNFLFFGREGRNGKNTAGIFDIFNKYHFTIEENTPLEQEVALDPELLGKVFENLLAAYNPETRETVRKKTGSYYTPRTVVDYMIDKSLILKLYNAVSEMLINKNQQKISKKQSEDLKIKIQNLLDHSYGTNNSELTDIESNYIVCAISEIKIIDPAVGSGAFLMAALHKLTLMLKRVDPDNKIWERLQRDIVKKRINTTFGYNDIQLRETQLRHINSVFEEYRKDFGRKLYLIQNNIYGVDIQPIAVQIARLRFFISLAIEQNPTLNPKNNYNIHPLPNLDTKFVAADTLMPLSKSLQYTLGQTDFDVTDLTRLLLNNREQYFHATAPELKIKYKQIDVMLRKQLASALKNTKKKAGYLDKIVDYDPYDQNKSSGWFDAEYMFGISTGFDIVIGNPPYNPLQDNNRALANKYQNLGYDTFECKGDIYQLFFERGSSMLNPYGILSYITSNSWLKTEYGGKTRSYFSKHHAPYQLIEMGKDVFESAIVDSCVLISSLNEENDTRYFPAIDMDDLSHYEFPPSLNSWNKIRLNGESSWRILSDTSHTIMNKIETNGVPIKKWDVKFNRGITSGCNSAFFIKTDVKNKLIVHDKNSKKIIKPMLRGKDIRKFYLNWNDYWLINSRKGIKIINYPAIHKHLSKYRDVLSKKTGNNKWFELQGSTSDELNSMFAKEKLFWADMSATGRFSYSNTMMYCNNKGYVMTGDSLKYLCAVLNSNLIEWYIQNTAATTGMGLTEWTIVTVERIPIPKLSIKKQGPFISFIDIIDQNKSSDLNTNIQKYKERIDTLVYELYGLTSEEINIVEKYLKIKK